jgi:hypothetical protein
MALNFEVDFIAIMLSEKTQNDQKIVHDGLGSFPVDSVVAQVAISEPEFSHGLVDLLGESFVRKLVPFLMGAEMKTLRCRTRFDELLTYLGGEVSHNGVLLIFKGCSYGSQLFLGHLQVLFEVSHLAPPGLFVIITKIGPFWSSFVIVSNFSLIIALSARGSKSFGSYYR